MISPAASTIDTVNRLLATDDGLTVCHDPPAYPANWQRFLSRLRYVVVDECHEYRGIFGTNVSYLFRRLRALCQRHGSSPLFIATSATVKSPQEHMERLTGLPFACVGPDEDGSHQGERKIWMVRSEDHPYDAARKFTLALAEEGLTVLTFCLSRTAAERMMARSGRDNKDEESPFVRVYRAGLTPAEREEIERGLRDRTVRAVFSTSALELGIDIGAIDVVVCVGLPTTMMSLWQRAGRAGKQGAVILIPGQTPIDAYHAAHPDRLFDRDHEPLVLNLKNQRVLRLHYACAAKEAGDEGRLDTNTFGVGLATPPVIAQVASDAAPPPVGNCPKCQWPQQPTARFCSNCGTKLEVVP